MPTRSPTAVDLDRFITISEAAARLGIGKSKAYALIAAGDFPVPVVAVAGKKKVSLRRLAEWMNGQPIELEVAS